MRVCIPTVDEAGLRSRLSSHFGKAPYYMVVDTDRWDMRTVINTNEHHEHGQCSPLASLAGLGVEAVVCRGLGRNALARLRSGGVPVYVSTSGTVAGALGSFLAGDLEELTSEEACHGAH